VSKGPTFIRWFNEVTASDVPLVGGKNAALGELSRELAGIGVRVPNGFAITADPDAVLPTTRVVLDPETARRERPRARSA
jgi:hypothetical protein